MAAVPQISHDTPGRVYYDRKMAGGKKNKEALRVLKRRMSNVVYPHLKADSEQHDA
jgi:transposase